VAKRLGINKKDMEILDVLRENLDFDAVSLIALYYAWLNFLEKREAGSFRCRCCNAIKSGLHLALWEKQKPPNV